MKFFDIKGKIKKQAFKDICKSVSPEVVRTVKRGLGKVRINYVKKGEGE